MRQPTYFNAHHSPIGAFASFTFGSKGPRGGLGLELSGPADESLYVGVEDKDRPGQYFALPFFMPCGDSDSAEDYDVEGLSAFRPAPSVSTFADEQVSRSLGPCVDEWRAGDLTFKVFSPIRRLPDPGDGQDERLRDAVTPSVTVELTIDNRGCANERKVFFGYAGSARAYAMRVWNESGIVGVGQGTMTGIATDALDAYAGIAWQPEAILDPKHASNLKFMLGSIGMIVVKAPPDEIRTIRFVACFFREGTATTGIATRYLYRRWFDRIEDVAKHGLARAESDVRESNAIEARLPSLTPERRLMLGQAIRSYYGSTQLLEGMDGRPLWVVNEGEYRMMNTFDLMVDQAFFELCLNPWTIRNGLDLFAERYSYRDEVRRPGGTATEPGGIAFTHDMGVANAFSDAGRSSYEQSGLRGCFSYMCCEELVNWVLCACLYAGRAEREWLEAKRATFAACLESLMNRDDPDPERRNGVMGLDGARCEGGSEITTYDSLDASLGQARNNVYLAVKTWAAYVLLEPVLSSLNEGALADAATRQARLCARTIVEAADEVGCLPAVLGEGVAARIVPAIEGLVYPYLSGRKDVLAVDGPYGELVSTLRRHLDQVLKPGVCLFDDGGWRLSSTSRNSWLSKIYLCQFVAERILGMTPDTVADCAHLSWLMREDNAYYAWSDQMLAGKAVGSRYYPRGVTGILWLDEKGCLRDVGRRLLGEDG